MFVRATNRMGDPSDLANERRLSLPSLFSGIGEAIARTAEAAGTLLTDVDLRKRGAQVLASNATKGLRGIQQGNPPLPPFKSRW